MNAWLPVDARHASGRMRTRACCGCEHTAERSGRDDALSERKCVRIGGGWLPDEGPSWADLVLHRLLRVPMTRRRGFCTLDRAGHALIAFPSTPPPFYSFFSRDRRRRRLQERREALSLQFLCLNRNLSFMHQEQNSVKGTRVPRALRSFLAVPETFWQTVEQVQRDLVGDNAPPLLNMLLASISTSAIAVALPSPKSSTKKKKKKTLASSPYAGLPSPPVGTPAAPLRPRRRVRTGQKKPKWVKELPPSSVELAREIAVASEVNWSGFIRPVDKIWEVSSDFGPRWGRHHNGVDLAAPQGEPVLAADGGIVSFAGFEPTGYGYLVEITHQDGWRTLYAHNSSVYTWEGQTVKRGECIASVGATGRATGPHLHWEIRNRWGSPVDPAGYVDL